MVGAVCYVEAMFRFVSICSYAKVPDFACAMRRVLDPGEHSYYEAGDFVKRTAWRNPQIPEGNKMFELFNDWFDNRYHCKEQPGELCACSFLNRHGITIEDDVTVYSKTYIQ